MGQNTKIILAAVLGALFMWFVMGGKRDCPKVKIPEIKDSIPKQKPIYIVERDTVIKWETIEVISENPVNDSLVEAYKRAKDSLDRFKLYVDAIKIRKFTSEFSDENIDLTISGEVQGELNWFKPNYTIKEREVESEKQVVYRILLGGHVQNSLLLDDFSYSANLGFQNEKGNIFRIGYSKIFSKDYLMLGYDIPLLTIKK